MKHGAIFLALTALAACDGSSEPAARSSNDAGAPATAGPPAATPTPGDTSAPSGPLDARDAGGDGALPALPLDATSTPAPPPSLCGADDWLVTSVSTAWGPAWSKPDPSKIVSGWPLELRYELWWLPMPARVLAYRITVPASFDAQPNANAWTGYVRAAESPSTPVAWYDAALSETACDTSNSVPIQAVTAPYAPIPSAPLSGNALDVSFRVRPKNQTHCAGDWPLPCLEPGRTYYFNLRLTDGCPLYDANGNVTSDPSKCQPMIHVMRPKQIGEP